MSIIPVVCHFYLENERRRMQSYEEERQRRQRDEGARLLFKQCKKDDEFLLSVCKMPYLCDLLRKSKS